MESLNPRVDFAFKLLFGSEENKDILISFINAVISQENKIIEVTLLNPFNSPRHKGDKLSVLDIKATDEKGRYYNIEMQIRDQIFYNQRALYYWSKMYAGQLASGSEYGELKKTISINILNFNYFNEPDYHNVFKILNTKTHQNCFDDLELHFIELKKFDKDLHALTTTLDRWSTFLTKADMYGKDNIPLELKQEPSIEKAIHCLETACLNKEDRELYEARLKFYRDEDAVLTKACLDAKAEGKAEEKAKVAINMLQLKIPKEIIADVTGLMLSEIEKLAK